MREIKFRAWDEEENKMFYTGTKTMHGSSFLLNLSGDILDAYPKHEMNYDIVWGRIGHTLALMQYTGLKDKNGVEIYEGDIFEIIKHSSTKFTVVYAVKEEYKYEPVYACFALRNGTDFLPFDEFALEYGKVIGNIYENPELLEGK